MCCASRTGLKHDIVGSVRAQHGPHCRVRSARPERACRACVRISAQRAGMGTARHGGVGQAVRHGAGMTERVWRCGNGGGTA